MIRQCKSIIAPPARDGREDFWNKESNTISMDWGSLPGLACRSSGQNIYDRAYRYVNCDHPQKQQLQAQAGRQAQQYPDDRLNMGWRKITMTLCLPPAEALSVIPSSHLPDLTTAFTVL